MGYCLSGFEVLFQKAIRGWIAFSRVWGTVEDGDLIRKLYSLVTHLAQDSKKLNINAFAASAAFFLFISLVPMIGLACSILPMTPLTEKDLLAFLLQLTPDIFDGVITQIVHQVYDASAGVFTVSVIIAVWASSKGVQALIQGLNVVNGIEEKRNYFLVRIVSCGYMLIMLATVLVPLILVVVGAALNERFLRKLPFAVDVTFLREVLLKPRALYLLIFLTLVFALLYTFLPCGRVREICGVREKIRYRGQLAGAMFAAVAWIILSYVFTLYATYSTTLSVYGSLTTIVVAMFWMYACMTVLLYGAYCSRYFAEWRRRENAGQEPAPKK